MNCEITPGLSPLEGSKCFQIVQVPSPFVTTSLSRSFVWIDAAVPAACADSIVFDRNAAATQANASRTCANDAGRTDLLRKLDT